MEIAYLGPPPHNQSIPILEDNTLDTTPPYSEHPQTPQTRRIPGTQRTAPN